MNVAAVTIRRCPARRSTDRPVPTFDPRNYFPARRVTRPRPDALTMVQAVGAIALRKAS